MAMAPRDATTAPALPARRSPKRAPSKPGGLMREILTALDLPLRQAALRMGVSRPTLYDVFAGKQPLTADVAVRFEKLTGAPIDALYRMQAEYDLWEARQRLAPEKIKSARKQDAA
jgi:addiction module HigA family antidote